MRKQLEILVGDMEEVGDRLGSLIVSASHSELEETKDALIHARMIQSHAETMVLAALEKLPVAPRLEIVS